MSHYVYFIINVPSFPFLLTLINTVFIFFLFSWHIVHGSLKLLISHLFALLAYTRRPSSAPLNTSLFAVFRRASKAHRSSHQVSAVSVLLHRALTTVHFSALPIHPPLYVYPPLPSSCPIILSGYWNANPSPPWPAPPPHLHRSSCILLIFSASTGELWLYHRRISRRRRDVITVVCLACIQTKRKAI